MSDIDRQPTFSDLGLPAQLVRAVTESGYESPSAIQSASIPVLLEGRDILGQAQTGTGKTAAFALPLLARLDLRARHTQALVLTPTRELAIQVAEALQHYARYLKGFHVMPIYGGSGYGEQLRGLKRGTQVVVGTPGRLMDHMRKGSLQLENLRTLVLDEADEMLRMGFIDDVEWILQQTPPDRQTALFSATMPEEIQRISNRHLNNPEKIRIEVRTLTAESIEQNYWLVGGLHKLDALTRILETETFEAMILFVRTRAATQDLAEKLSARGYACEALNGDIPQNQRERTISRLKARKLDILVATDVAARGLDVDHITHVVNYDIPTDPEAYVHRIGRTGRAGRTGKALLFVAHRERHLLRAIERTIGRPIDRMELPSARDVNKLRIERFMERVQQTLDNADLDFYLGLLGELQEREETDPLRLAAALAVMVEGDEPLLLADQQRKPSRTDKRSRDSDGFRRDERQQSGERSRRKPSDDQRDRRAHSAARDKNMPEMVRYRIEVGAEHGVKPGNIVGAIANEAGLEGRYIGRIDIQDKFSLVDLPEGMPPEIFQALKKSRVAGQQLRISMADGEQSKGGRKRDDRPGNRGRKDGGRKPSNPEREEPGLKRPQGKRFEAERTNSKGPDFKRRSKPKR